MFQSDSGGTACVRPLRRCNAAPGMQKAKAPTKGLSALNSIAFGLAAYASPSSLPPPTQDSLPVAGQALLDGLLTRKIPMRGFKVASYISSSSPKLTWRNCIVRCRLRSMPTRSGESHLCAEAARARAFVAFTRVVEPHREGES